MRNQGLYVKIGKRLVDLAVAIPALALLTPLMATICGAILLLMGRPVFFRQQRSGLHGEPFRLLKFRSMLDVRDETGGPLPDCERMTQFGRFLRSWSLDELPQLWSVLLGDLSLIGPRPLLVGYEKYYTPRQARRLKVRPGLAGYAALFGRNAQSWENIFERDVWYVDHVSFGLDVEIMLKLIPLVLSRRGIERGDHDRGSPFAEALGQSSRQT